MQEVHHKLSQNQQASFYAAGLPAQQTSSVVAAGRVAKGHASLKKMPDPTSGGYYLAWGTWFAYGAVYGNGSEPARAQPYFVPAESIKMIAAERQSDRMTEMRLISDSGSELLALSVRGDPRCADELAEILGARITWAQVD